MYYLYNYFAHACMFFAIKGLMDEFGVCLDYRHLQHLVLSEKIEYEALHSVALFLCKNMSDKPIFHLGKQKATFDLAEKYAKKHLMRYWQEEKSDANMRVDNHWKEVLRKKSLASGLRKDLILLKDSLKDDLITAELNVKKAREEYALKKNKFQRHHSQRSIITPFKEAYEDCTMTLNNLKKRITDKEEEIRGEYSKVLKPCDRVIFLFLCLHTAAEKAPPGVVQPIAQKQCIALRTLFFLRMPDEFKYLSRISVTCQRSLLPNDWIDRHTGKNIFSNFVVKEFRFDFRVHYNVHHHTKTYHRSVQVKSVDNNNISLCSYNEPPSFSEIGPQHIDHISCKTQGIWYPDCMQSYIAWYGEPKVYNENGSKPYNPFFEFGESVSKNEIVSSMFTPVAQEEKLQWAFRQPGKNFTKSNRGNISYSKQGSKDKPTSLSRNQLFHVGRLRSFPNVMIRSLIVAWKDRALPMDQKDIRTLIQLTLYQVGKMNLADVSNMSILDHVFEWKYEFFDKDFRDKFLYDVIEEMCDDMFESPKSYKELAVLGEAIKFISYWDCNSIEFKYSHVITTTIGLFRSKGVMQGRGSVLIAKVVYAFVCFADIIENLISKSNTREIPTLRTKQAILLRHAYLVLSRRNASTGEIKKLVELVSRAKNLCIDANSENFVELQSLVVRCHNAACLILTNIVAACLNDDSILTHALQAVISKCPSSLQWKQIEETGKSCCFEALEQTKNTLYHVNVLTGTVLIDGLPPTMLPSSITNHLLYGAVFGHECNFEVVRESNWFRTRKPAHGKYYWFDEDKGNLHVNEEDEKTGHVLMLMDNITSSSGWVSGIDLPPRLISLYSHWLDYERDILFLRGKSFTSRKPEFVIFLNGSKGGNVDRCFSVPETYKGSLHSISIEMFEEEAFDELVLIQENSTLSQIVSTLAKFEDKKYIHVFINTKRELNIRMPRFDLSFCLDNENVISRDYTGFRLRKSQQLVDILHGFQNYLVFEKQRSNNRREIFIVVPDRSVVIDSSHCMISLEKDEDCDSIQKAFRFDVHHRFDYLIAEDIESRLFLASLHLATSRLLPDSRLQMTGEERAIQLLRQCRSTRPPSHGILTKLDMLTTKLGCSYPVVLLLCREIIDESRRLDFLYQSEVNQAHALVYSDAADAYKSICRSERLSYRRRLAKGEELKLIGSLAFVSQKKSFTNAFSYYVESSVGK